jgi:predicted nucleotidyltransferase component of viral defense system
MFEVRALETIEMIAEKVRAAFQRTKVRDLYDLHRFATKPFDGELLRALVVLKLWQVRDPFVPDALFEKLRSGKYDWADLQRLLRIADRVEPHELIATVERRFDVLRHLTELERAAIADARRARSSEIVERLRAEIRQRAGSVTPGSGSGHS